MPSLVAMALEAFAYPTSTTKNLCVIDTDIEPGYKGKSFAINKPGTCEITDVTPGATPPALTNLAPTATQATLTNWEQNRFNITEKEAQQMRSNNFFPEQIKENVYAFASRVNDTILATAKNGVYQYVGTAGTTPFASTLDVLAEAEASLNAPLNRCPQDARALIVNQAAFQNMRNNPKLQVFQNFGDRSAVADQTISRIMNFQPNYDLNVPTHTAGTSSGTLINGAVAVGASTAAIDTGTGTLTVGDIFTVAGDTQTYVVTTAVADVSAGTLNFSPPVQAAAGWANNAAVTVKASFVQNIAGRKGAFGLFTRPEKVEVDGLSTLPTLAQASQAINSNGVWFTLSLYPGYHCTQLEISALWGPYLRDARQACYIAG